MIIKIKGVKLCSTVSIQKLIYERKFDFFMGDLDYLIGFVEESRSKEWRKKERFIATSFECNISAGGDSKKEAAKKLAALLNGHLKDTSDRNINPFYTNIERFEKFGKYCIKNGKLPRKVCDVEIDGGLTLRCYDMTT